MILVPGGVAMIGAHTAEALLVVGEEVVAFRHRNADAPSFLADRVTVEQPDVTDRDAALALDERHRVTGVLHLGAAGLLVADPVELLRVNPAGRPTYDRNEQEMQP